MTNQIEELIFNERKFLDGNGTFKNQQGVYLFISDDGNERIDLSFFLLEYKQWLIENRIVREPNQY